MIMPMSLWPIKSDALQKPPGMTLMFSVNLKLMMIWPHLSQEIDQGAILDNKRLGRTLEFIKLVQDKHFVLTAYPMG